MLDPNSRLVPNSEEVAAKVMEGEAILINLSSGVYYSLDLVGGLAWQLIEARCTLAEIIETVTAQYDVDGERAQADLRRLIDQLVEAGLVRLLESEPPGGAMPPVSAGGRLPYETPVLSAYHDMAELLALDPPHPALSETLSKPLDER